MFTVVVRNLRTASHSNGYHRNIPQVIPSFGSLPTTSIRSFAAVRQNFPPISKNRFKDVGKVASIADGSAKRGGRSLGYHYLRDQKSAGKILSG